MEERRYYLFWNYFIMIWILVTFLAIIWAIVIFKITRLYTNKTLYESESRWVERDPTKQNIYKHDRHQLISQTFINLRSQQKIKTKTSCAWYVYIYSCAGNCKIWLAKCRESRIKHHMTSSPQKIDLVIVLKVSNMSFFEKLIHASFKDKRLHWEFFNLNELDIDVIKEYFWQFIVKEWCNCTAIT